MKIHSTQQVTTSATFSYRDTLHRPISNHTFYDNLCITPLFSVWPREIKFNAILLHETCSALVKGLRNEYQDLFIFS